MTGQRRRGRRSDPAAPGTGGATPLSVGDAAMDPLDRVVGRAYLDPWFRALLLRWPSAALDDEPLPEELREWLSAIRAADLVDFAAVALRGYRRAPPGSSARP